LKEEEKPSKEEYQKEKTIKIAELHLERGDLEGEIDLRTEEYSKLERIYYNKKVNIVSD